ncbi:MAG: AAA family ATPase [Acidimicrobiia bacterium]
MNDAESVIVCAAGASWELPLVRAFQQRALGIRVDRRCADHGELLGTALRDRPRAVIVDARVPWIDRELVTTLQRSDTEVLALGTSGRDLPGIGVRCFPADVSPDVVAAAIHNLEAPLHDRRAPGPAGDGETRCGRVTVTWGGAGSPGRTTIAVHLAIESQRSGRHTLLIDADVWNASVAQVLGLAESPSVAQAARAASTGSPEPLTGCLQPGPDGLMVLVGLPRAELWPEVREASWRALLSAARAEFDVVVIDVAAPIEEDEELVADRIGYRRNLVTTVALELADEVVLLAAADPVGLRRAVLAHRALVERPNEAERSVSVALNRVPRAARRLQDCSRSVGEWFGGPPVALLPEESAFDRVVWEGRPLHDVAPRSAWLRELQALMARVIA